MIRVGLPPALRRSLRTTNPIESAFARHEQLAHRVQWWRNGGQAPRWAALTLLQAEASFRNLPGAEALPRLTVAVEQRLSPPADVAA